MTSKKQKLLTPRQTAMARRLQRELGIDKQLATRATRVVAKEESKRVLDWIRRKKQKAEAAG